ncbi:MAG: glycosyltransferase family 2 protein [Desulfarculus sp.]|nr:glycosyltransferase family 2 protein [Desulfarculus sp.]
MPTLSVALICRNEAANLPAWLVALTGVADQIVAVDSGSSDDTVAILEAAGARVVRREFTGYADQRNAAAALCTGDWILCLDADERPDPQLRAALQALRAGPEPCQAGYELNYQVFFFGRHLRHGGYAGERHLRLHRRGAATWIKREVHERLEVRGEVGRLPGFVEHHSYQTVGEYLRRMDVYSAQAARQMAERGRQTSGFSAWGHAAWAFFSRYLLRLGFLDGFEGYLAARLESLYTLTKYARLRELRRGLKDRGK